MNKSDIPENLHAKAMEAAITESTGDVELFTKIRRTGKPTDILPSRSSDAWVAGFGVGYAKAWETMQPIMMDGVLKSREQIRNQAIEETLTNLEEVIEKRVIEAKDSTLRAMNDILAKRDEFRKARDLTTDALDKVKYDHYLMVMDWIILKHAH